MTVLSDPSLDEAEAAIRTCVGAKARVAGLLLMVGRCQVRYEGRAASLLEAGDRLVVIKPDGTLLLHGAEGVKPINWQPPGTSLELERQTGALTLWARRSRPPELVEVRFEKFQAVVTSSLDDRVELELTGTEFDLRDLLRAHPELVEPGFRPWSKERMTDQGPMDLYGEDAAGRRVVVEVKRTRAGIAEATQLWRYVEAERRRRTGRVRGILIASKASPRAIQLLNEHDLEFLARSWDDARVRAVRGRAGPRQPKLHAFEPRAESKR